MLRELLREDPAADVFVDASRELLRRGKAVDALGILIAALDRRKGDSDALALLARLPETDAVRKVAAAARLSTTPDDDYDAKLVALLDRVKADEAARQEYVDILELMGPDDPRTAGYRKQLTSRLF